MTKLLTDIVDVILGFILSLLFCILITCGLVILIVGFVIGIPIIVVWDAYQCYLKNENGLIFPLSRRFRG
jgi:hypothetical protein